MGKTINTTAIETEIDQLIVTTGKLVKSYLINTDYKKNPFKVDSNWISSLGLLQSHIARLVQLSNSSVPELVNNVLKKYAQRKNSPDLIIPNDKKFQSDDEYRSAVLDVSFKLFGKSSVEADLFDFMSELCELYEVFKQQREYLLSSKDWLDELGDIAYLSLKLST